MYPGAANPGEVKVKALGKGDLEICRDQFHIRVDSLHLLDTLIPELVQVVGAWVATLVGFQLFQRHVKHERHRDSPLCWTGNSG